MAYEFKAGEYVAGGSVGVVAKDFITVFQTHPPLAESYQAMLEAGWELQGVPICRDANRGTWENNWATTYKRIKEV